MAHPKFESLSAIEMRQHLLTFHKIPSPLLEDIAPPYMSTGSDQDGFKVVMCSLHNLLHLPILHSHGGDAHKITPV